MDFEAKFSEFSQIIKQYWLPLTLAIFGLIFFIYGLISLLSFKSNPQELNLSSELSATKSATLISIDIEGAVVNPGVYKLPAGSIIQDGLVLANGLSQDADREYVSKNINLAAKLTDGAKVYIPKVGQINTNSQSQVQIQGQNPASTSNSLININTATSDQLDSLPGIGPVTAGKIINARPYTAIDDLLNNKIVSSKVFGEIKDKISVY